MMEEDELLALKSIYCLPGELDIVHGAEKDTQVRVQLHRDDGVDVKVVLDITPSYPHTPPDVSILSAAIDRSVYKTLRDTANQHVTDNTGSPMLIELISVLQDKLSSLSLHQTEDESGSLSQDPESVTLMLHVDHMRAKTQYVKTIRRWTGELCLDGRLVFCNKLILILLQGNPSSLKEYLVRHKSVNIDVDSRGHPCKEKMMSVLCETSLPADARFEDFRVVECESSKEVKKLFDEHRMGALYVNYVQTIKGFI